MKTPTAGILVCTFLSLASVAWAEQTPYQTLAYEWNRAASAKWEDLPGYDDVEHWSCTFADEKTEVGALAPSPAFFRIRAILPQESPSSDAGPLFAKPARANPEIPAIDYWSLARNDTRRWSPVEVGKRMAANKASVSTGAELMLTQATEDGRTVRYTFKKGKDLLFVRYEVQSEKADFQTYGYQYCWDKYAVRY